MERALVFGSIRSHHWGYGPGASKKTSKEEKRKRGKETGKYMLKSS